MSSLLSVIDQGNLGMVFLPRGRPFRTGTINKTQGFFAPHTGQRVFSTLGTPGRGCQRLQASQPCNRSTTIPPSPLSIYPQLLPYSRGP